MSYHLTPEMLVQLQQLSQGPVVWDALLDRPAASRLVDQGLAKRVYIQLQIELTEEGHKLMEAFNTLKQETGG